MKNLFLIFVSLIGFCSVSAQVSFYSNDSTSLLQNKKDDSISIFDQLAAPDSTTNAFINVFQDSSIYEIINKPEYMGVQEMKGFRIQLFSSNNGMVAREHAFEIKETLIQKYPAMEEDIYVTYTSPFWKVRIGNCRTHDNAVELRTWITSEFPQFADETYIVPSIILIK